MKLLVEGVTAEVRAFARELRVGPPFGGRSVRHASGILAAGFGIGAAIVCRGIGGAVGLPAALAAMLVQAIGGAARLVFVVLGGAVVPVLGIAANAGAARAGRSTAA
ncbi:hypothetical protein [Streptomyces sp. NPDC002845]